MLATADYDKNFLYFKQLTKKELDWLEENLTWWERAGSLKDLKEGDYVQEGKTKKVGKVIEIDDKNITYQLRDGTERTLHIYDLTRVESQTLLYENKQGVYYTLLGLTKLIEKESGAKIEIENQRVNKYERVKVDPAILDGITLEDFQLAAVVKGLTIQRGLLAIPTGGGKTEIMLATIRYILDAMTTKERIAVVVPTVLLADQFQARARDRGYTKKSVGVISGSSKEWDAKVLVFTMPSLLLALRSKDPEIMKIVAQIKHLFVDETHHLRCDSMVEILRRLGAIETLLGYSGSPFLLTEPLEEAGDTLMWGLTGGIIYSVPYEYLIQIGFIARPIVLMRKMEGKMLKYPGRFQKIYDSFVVKHSGRNDLVARYADRAINMGFKVLILVQRLNHAGLIMDQLRNHKVISVFGGKTSVTFDDVTEEAVVGKIDYNNFRTKFESGGYDVAIGSTVADEGMDLPSVGVVIMAGGGKSRIKVLQRLGRGLRKKKVGQNVVYVIDFKDTGHVYLNSQSNKRLALYKEAAADILEEEIIFWQRMHVHAKQLKGE